MATLDWVIVGLYCGVMIVIGIVLSKRASRGTDDYFISGRKLTWWLAGTSLVATSFASDTPLLVTGLVRTKGIWGNWMWWALAISNVMAIFFFSRLWRRTGAVTEVQLTEMRYSGKPAAMLRGFKAIYYGVGFNCFVAGAWVMTGLVIIMTTCAPELYDEADPERSKFYAILFCSVIAVIYATLAGFWGVVTTDFIQFILAMLGAILLCGFALAEIGGISVFW
ncbi:sodium:proline symporter, partial [Planctomycetota bacterium]